MTRIQKRARLFSVVALLSQIALGLGVILGLFPVGHAGAYLLGWIDASWVSNLSIGDFQYASLTTADPGSMSWLPLVFAAALILGHGIYLFAIAQVFRRLMELWASGHVFTEASAARIRTLGIGVGCYTILPTGMSEAGFPSASIQINLIFAGLLITLVGWTFMEATKQREELEEVV
ncbi:MAG: hypothetical protein AB8H79_00455 [Myxococcota bacterium]